MTEPASGVDFFAERYQALLAERDALASEAAKAAEVARVSVVEYGEALDALMRAPGYVPKSERTEGDARGETYQGWSWDDVERHVPRLVIERDHAEAERDAARREADQARAELDAVRVELERVTSANDGFAKVVSALQGERDAVRNEALDLRLLNAEMVAALHEAYERVAVFPVEREYQFGEKQAILLVLSTAIANRVALSVAATDIEETP